MNQPSTPDAVRAAIAEIVRKLPYALELTDSGPPTPKDYADAIYDRLAKIGALRPVGDDDLALAFALGCAIDPSGEMTDDQERDYARLFPKSETAQLVRLKQDAAARAGDGATVTDMSGTPIAVPRHNPTE